MRASHVLPFPRLLALACVLAAAALLPACGGEKQEGGSAASAGQTGCAPGDVAPSFELTSLAGDRLSKDALAGDVIILDFWATWCAPCRMVIPHLKDIHREFGERGVSIVAVAMDNGGAGAVSPFVSKLGIDYPVALPSARIAEDYCGIMMLPTTFVIAPDGRVHRKLIGATSKDTLLKVIYELKPELRPAATAGVS